jgi:hypothetical protein
MFPPLNPTSRATSRGGLCVCPPFKPWFRCFGDFGDGESLSSAPNEHQRIKKGGPPPNDTFLRLLRPKRAKSVTFAKFEIPLTGRVERSESAAGVQKGLGACEGRGKRSAPPPATTTTTTTTRAAGTTTTTTKASGTTMSFERPRETSRDFVRLRETS